MVCILFGGWLAQKLPNARIYVCIGMLVPTFIGLLLQIVLPRSNVAGLLIGGKPSNPQLPLAKTNFRIQYIYFRPLLPASSSSFPFPV